MSPSEDAPVVIEETELDVAERSGPSPWLVLGIIAAILAVVFGVRAVRSRKLAQQEAIPSDIGDVGDPAFERTHG